MALKIHELKQLEPPKEYVAPENNDPIEPIEGEITFEKARAFVRMRNRAACSDLMKAFNITYAGAAHLMDALEEREVIMPVPYSPQGAPLYAGPRKVIG